MKVKMILPALTEAVSPFFQPIKYSAQPGDEHKPEMG